MSLSQPRPRYRAEATVHSQSTTEGMTEKPTHIARQCSPIEASAWAQTWSRNGYFVAIYNEDSNELVDEKEPA